MVFMSEKKIGKLFWIFLATVPVMAQTQTTAPPGPGDYPLRAENPKEYVCQSIPKKHLGKINYLFDSDKARKIEMFEILCNGEQSPLPRKKVTNLIRRMDKDQANLQKFLPRVPMALADGTVENLSMKSNRNLRRLSKNLEGLEDIADFVQEDLFQKINALELLTRASEAGEEEFFVLTQISEDVERLKDAIDRDGNIPSELRSRVETYQKFIVENLDQSLTDDQKGRVAEYMGYLIQNYVRMYQYQAQIRNGLGQVEKQRNLKKRSRKEKRQQRREKRAEKKGKGIVFPGETYESKQGSSQ